MLFVCQLVWLVFFFPAAAVTAQNRALWADPAAALPGPLGGLLPWTRHRTAPARPTFPHLPQIRDLRICLADPGTAGRSLRAQRCPAEGGSWAETPSWNLLPGDTWRQRSPCLSSNLPLVIPSRIHSREQSPSRFPPRANPQRSGAPCPGHGLTALRPGKRRAWGGERDRPFPSDSRQEK